MENWLKKLGGRGGEDLEFRLMDYPMHYFAAIQTRNQINVSRVLEPIGIDPLEWRVLATLSQRSSTSIKEISEVTAIDRFKVSRVIKRLTERRMISDNVDIRNKRTRPISITKEGAEKYQEALAIMKKVYLANFDGLSEQEFVVMMGLLRRIKDNINRVEGFY